MWPQSQVKLGEALLVVASLLIGGSLLQAQEQTPPVERPASQSTCLVCHSNLGGSLAAPTKPFPEDVHAGKGLTCASCHGGDPTSMEEKVAMSAAKGFRGKPSRQQVPEFCGRCHSNVSFMHQFNPSVKTDQVSQYYTSLHGQQLRSGDQRVATCINCHSVHDIKLVSDPSAPVYPLNIPDTCGRCHSDEQYMAGYDLPGLTQVTEYKTSVHYNALTVKGDLSAPTCVSCHGSHGATPPGVRSVADVCGTCHAHNLEYFEKSPHQAAFAALGVPGCVQCHSNHAIQPTGEKMLVGNESVCMTCHLEGDNGANRAQEMAASLGQLDSRIQLARDVLAEADRAGMDVSSATATLTAAHSHLIMARTAVHSLDLAQVEEEINQGLPTANQAVEEGHQKLAEVQSRRRGFGLFALLVVAIVVCLYLYIRQEKESPSSASSSLT